MFQKHKRELETTLIVEPLGLCVCGRKIAANADKGAVVHEVPYCEAFLKLDPLDFLTYVRRSRGIPDPPR